MDKQEKEKRIAEITDLSNRGDFWSDPSKAKDLLQELQILKSASDNPHAKAEAIVSIVSGAGGDDAEDFARMLMEMYLKFCENSGWGVDVLEKNVNPNNGVRGVTFLVNSKNSYGQLKNEQGVHRLVRLSPFNSNNKRQTSFVLVDVIPKIGAQKLTVPESDIRVDLSNSSGPGGQNVNKRETAVRLTHLTTNISVRVERERTQEKNKELAMSLLLSKLQHILNKHEKDTLEELSFDKSLKIEWGNQIRSYVLHPYKLVKDHRVNYQESNTDSVFSGNIQGFINAAKDL